MKKVILAAVIFLTAGAVLYAAEPQQFSVTGYGKVSYQVDLVDVQFSISMRDNDAESSRRKHDKIVVKVNRYLEEKEYPEGVLLLQSSILRLQESTTGKSRDSFYLARSAYLIRTDRVQDTNALQAELVEIGVDEIQSVTLFSSKQRQLEGDAQKLALEDAIKKADLTAKTLGLKLGKPVSVCYEAPSITFDSSIEVIVKVTFSYQADTNVQETVPA
ncbi:MAG: SIMPL domain-containing protein, partial [bacterium]